MLRADKDSRKRILTGCAPCSAFDHVRRVIAPVRQEKSCSRADIDQSIVHGLSPGHEDMIMKTHSKKSNAVRAARKELGAEAKPGVDFNLVQGGGGGWAWEPAIAPIKAQDAPLLAIAAE